MDGVGEEQRNAIDQRMQEEFRKRGYKPGNYPSPEQTEDLAVRIGQEIALTGLKSQLKPRPKPKTPTPEIKGGTPAGANWSEEVKEGRPEEVAKQLKAMAAKGIYPEGWQK
jgi:hypothetical protein